MLSEQPSLMLGPIHNLPETAGIGSQNLWPPASGHEPQVMRYGRLFCGFILLPTAGLTLFAVLRRQRLSRAAKACVWILILSLVSAILFLGDPRIRVPFDPTLPRHRRSLRAPTSRPTPNYTNRVTAIVPRSPGFA